MIFSEYIRSLTEETHNSSDDVKDFIICKTDAISEKYIKAAEDALYAFTFSKHVANDKTWRNMQSTKNHETALHILNYAQEKYDEQVKIVRRKLVYQSKLPYSDEKKLKELRNELKHADIQRVADRLDVNKLLTLRTVPYATQVKNDFIKCVLHYIGPVVKPEKDKTVEEKRQSMNAVIYDNIDVWLRIIVSPSTNRIISAHVFDLDNQFIDQINKKQEYNAQRVGNDCIVTYTPANAEPVHFSLNKNDFIK